MEENKIVKTFKADLNELDNCLAFVEGEAEKFFDMRVINQLNICAEEIFTNIAKFAYHPEDGNCDVEIINEPDKLVIKFIDKGTQFDPLAKEDPDITLSAEERDIGGLGIFMVKKMMDDVKYEYKNGENILTIVKLVKEK